MSDQRSVSSQSHDRESAAGARRRRADVQPDASPGSLIPSLPALHGGSPDPSLLTSSDVLALQRDIGNRAVLRMLRPSPQPAPRSAASSVVQRFGSTEHQQLGKEASGNADVNLGGEEGDWRFMLEAGDVVALSGDFFSAEELMSLAEKPGDMGAKAGTRDEIIYALHWINAKDPRFARGGRWQNYSFSRAVEDAVTTRYNKLAADNTSHFVAPRGRNAAGEVNPPQRAGETNAGSRYHELHEQAIKAAYEAGRSKREIEHPLALEAAAQHHLSDIFASGHFRTETANMHDYWHKKYPLFWYNLRHKLALDTAIRLNAQSENLTTWIGTVQMMYEAISEQVEAMAGDLPAVTLGDLLSMIFHNIDNERGVKLEGGGSLYGDSQLNNPDPENASHRLAVSAMKEGNEDIRLAYEFGKSGTYDLAGESSGKGQGLDEAALYTAISTRSSGAPDLEGSVTYVAERFRPKPSADNPQQNWKANSIEELWTKPMLGNSGPTVGEKISGAVRAGEIHDTLVKLGNNFPENDERWTGDLKPRQAYLSGFVDPLVANPREGLLSIINWAPNYGLRGVDRDDVSLASGEQLRKGGQLGGMTTPARVKYIRELIDGSVGADEEQLVVDIFAAARASERPNIYQLIEGHPWAGDWKHGVFERDDDLWDALNRKRLAKLRDLINEGGGARSAR